MKLQVKHLSLFPLSTDEQTNQRIPGTTLRNPDRI